MIKTYSELSSLKTFKERYHYLKLDNIVGIETFGSERHLNQWLYRSYEWKQTRTKIILRDEGRDLGCEGFEVYGRIIIHHINPIGIDDIINRSPKVFDPENLILTSHNTHQAIHYGSENLLIQEPIERSQNDTSPWK